MRTHVAPPHPRRDACQPAQFQHAIGRAPGVVSLDNDLAVLHIKTEAVVTARALHNADDGSLGSHGLAACHQFHVGCKQSQRLFYHGSRLAHHLICDGLLPVVPDDIGGTSRQRCHCRQQQCALPALCYRPESLPVHHRDAILYFVRKDSHLSGNEGTLGAFFFRYFVK